MDGSDPSLFPAVLGSLPIPLRSFPHSALLFLPSLVLGTTAPDFPEEGKVPGCRILPCALSVLASDSCISWLSCSSVASILLGAAGSYSCRHAIIYYFAPTPLLFSCTSH